MIGQAGKNNANIYITGSKRWMGNLNTSTLQREYSGLLYDRINS
jgi:hypothetical protein